MKKETKKISSRADVTPKEASLFGGRPRIALANTEGHLVQLNYRTIFYFYFFSINKKNYFVSNECKAVPGSREIVPGASIPSRK